jgi:hypothetical protein
MSTPTPKTFYCYVDSTRNSAKKENTFTFAAKDAETKETKYVLIGIKPDGKHQIPSTIFCKSSHPEYIRIQTTITPITPHHEDVDSMTGRPFTHRFSWGEVVTETPTTGFWEPRRFDFKGRKYVWLKEGGQDRLYEYSSSRMTQKKKITVTEFETVKPAIASANMPFWAGFFLSRYLEVRVAEGVGEDLLEVILAGTMVRMMVQIYSH